MRREPVLYSIPVSDELYERLEQAAKARGKTVDQLTEEVITTILRLEAYDKAIRDRATALLDKERLGDALDTAKAAYDRAVIVESDAIDAVIAAEIAAGSALRSKAKP